MPNILVVDERTGNASAYENLASLLPGFRFQVARDRDGAVAELRANPAVILVDEALVKGDTIGLIQRLRNAAAEDRPVFAVFGQSRPDAARHLRSAGADAYLPKPREPQQLADLLHSLVNLYFARRRARGAL